MSHQKISVVVLGSEDSLKKDLITNILANDLFKLPEKKKRKRKKKKKNKHENNTYMVKCTSALHTACEIIKDSNRHPDMCLLVEDNGFSPEEVLTKIKQLQEETGRPKGEFRVVLPPSFKHTESYPFSVYTMEQVVTELRKFAEDRHPPTDERIHNGSKPQCPMVVKDAEMHTDTKVNLVLLGLAGTGKSASGNTILGKELFMSRASSNQITTECQEAETQIGGTHVRVIDTPDIFDEDIKSSVKEKHVTKCKQLCQSGPCVYLLVMQVSRFTDGERDILKKLETAFGNRAQDQTVILFTRGDDLQRDKMSLEDFLQHCQPDLKKIVEKCGYRCVVFENNASDSHQVEELMQTVDRILKEQQKE